MLEVASAFGERTSWVARVSPSAMNSAFRRLTSLSVNECDGNASAAAAKAISR